MHCNQIAICRRYFVNNQLGIDAVFFVIEDAQPSDFDSAMARYQVWDEDFRVFLQAVERGQLKDYKLLVSVDGKYASLAKYQPDSSDALNSEDRLGLFGASYKKLKFNGKTFEQLQAEFQSHLLRHPDLFQVPGIQIPALKMKNRIDFSKVSWGELHNLAAIPEALHGGSLHSLADDVLALTLFTAGYQTDYWPVDVAENIVTELIRRLDEDSWGGYRYIDYKHVTPREVITRRLRAEKTLRELDLINYEFNMRYGKERVQKAISRLKGDHLTEVTILATLTRSEVAKDLQLAYEDHHFNASTTRVY